MYLLNNTFLILIEKKLQIAALMYYKCLWWYTVYIFFYKTFCMFMLDDPFQDFRQGNETLWTFPIALYILVNFQYASNVILYNTVYLSHLYQVQHDLNF